MKLFGKILTSIFGVLIPIALVGVICYLAIPGFKTKVDDAFNKPETEIEQEQGGDGKGDIIQDDENLPPIIPDDFDELESPTVGNGEESGTGEGEQIPETPATVSFAKNIIYSEV